MITIDEINTIKNSITNLECKIIEKGSTYYCIYCHKEGAHRQGEICKIKLQLAFELIANDIDNLSTKITKEIIDEVKNLYHL